MQADNIRENLFQAIDTIVAARVRKLNYDRTEIMTILDASGASNGIYKVTPDGQFIETIYSDNPTYKEGDQVYVTTMAGSSHKFINSMYMRRNGYSRINRDTGNGEDFKIYQYQQLTQDYIADLQDHIASTHNDLQDAMQNIYELYDDNVISELERDKRLAEIQKYYEEIQQRLQDELQSSMAKEQLYRNNLYSLLNE